MKKLIITESGNSVGVEIKFIGKHKVDFKLDGSLKLSRIDIVDVLVDLLEQFESVSGK